MRKPIYFVNAVDGMIEMTLEDGTKLPLTDDPKTIAVAIAAHGVSGYFGSSMDFADDYGFENGGDARALWKKGEEYFQLATFLVLTSAL